LGASAQCLSEAMTAASRTHRFQRAESNPRNIFENVSDPISGSHGVMALRCALQFNGCRRESPMRISSRIPPGAEHTASAVASSHDQRCCAWAGPLHLRSPSTSSPSLVMIRHISYLFSFCQTTEQLPRRISLAVFSCDFWIGANDLGGVTTSIF